MKITLQIHNLNSTFSNFISLYGIKCPLHNESVKFSTTCWPGKCTLVNSTSIWKSNFRYFLNTCTSIQREGDQNYLHQSNILKHNKLLCVSTWSKNLNIFREITPPLFFFASNASSWDWTHFNVPYSYSTVFEFHYQFTYIIYSYFDFNGFFYFLYTKLFLRKIFLAFIFFLQLIPCQKTLNQHY